MKPFMDENFLLANETARRIFHSYAKGQPIFDYHCHLSAKDLYENQRFDNLGELWLKGDHYKWRLMRANGVEERFITGPASFYEKYLAFADTLPMAAGNPVYHWTHMELQRYFGIHDTLETESAPQIWNQAQKVLNQKEITPQSVLRDFRVHTLYTTEDPVDPLSYHKALRHCPTRILPAFRPDRVLAINSTSYALYIKKLGQTCNFPIYDLDTLKLALQERMDVFDRVGCMASDHDVGIVPFLIASEETIAAIFDRAIKGAQLSEVEVLQFRTYMLLFLSQQYQKRKWVMELHIGCARDQNRKKVQEIGEAAGFDGILDYSYAHQLAQLLDTMQVNSQGLGKTVLFSMNPKDTWMLGAICGSFQNAKHPSNMQLGTAWWMQDHIWGMEQQINAYANNGLIGRFIGMLTDSRSLLSFPRHEYFRRVFCNWLGHLVERGEFPQSQCVLQAICEGVSFKNAELYFQKTDDMSNGYA